MAGAVAACFEWRATALTWTRIPQQYRYEEIRADIPRIYAMGCDEWFHSARVKICVIGDQNAENTAVVLGDSVLMQWFPALAAMYDKPGWRLLVLTKSACPMVDEPIFYERIGRYYTVCSEWRDSALSVLVSLRPNIVFIGGTSTYDYTEFQWVEGTRRVLERVAPFAEKVVIVLGTHTLPFDGPGCLARKNWRPAFLSLSDNCGSPVDGFQEKAVSAWLTRAASNFDNVKVLDPNPLICPDGRCYAEIGGDIVFRDSRHVSAKYVEKLTGRFARLVKDIGID
jgi:hypothetical protein